jgi:signal transduction histidine kinase
MQTPNDWRRFVAPLNIAGYITWLAIVLATWQIPIRDSHFAGVPTQTALLGLLMLFLAGFLVGTTRTDKTDARPVYFGLALMAGTAMLAFLTGVLDTTPVLLVILASVATATVSTRNTLLILLACNAVLLAALLQHRPLSTALLILMILCGFQAFAAFASHAIRRANESAAALQEVNAHLMATRSLLTESARDGERLRLSRELHDVAGHKLTALKLNLAVLAQDAGVADRREVITARTLADELLTDLRNVVSQLRRYDGIDLSAALQQLASVIPVPQVNVQVDPEARIDDAERAESLVRVAQESITNAARHAAARHVQLRLARWDEWLELTVQDDGKGAAGSRAGLGITGMRERVQALGGSLDIGVGEAGGVRVLARVPRVRPA